MRRRPGFAITAVLSLALGIGATTAVFTVVYGVLINPFPYVGADGVNLKIRPAVTPAEANAELQPILQDFATHTPGRYPDAFRVNLRSIIEIYPTWKERSEYFERLRAAVAAMPQVVSAGISTNATPPSNGGDSPLEIPRGVNRSDGRGTTRVSDAPRFQLPAPSSQLPAFSFQLPAFSFQLQLQLIARRPKPSPEPD